MVRLKWVIVVRGAGKLKRNICLTQSSRHLLSEKLHVAKFQSYNVLTMACLDHSQLTSYFIYRVFVKMIDLISVVIHTEKEKIHIYMIPKR